MRWRRSSISLPPVEPTPEEIFLRRRALLKELTTERPPTFWSALAPDEYGFWSNVDPDAPHPRWSQATERMLGTGERRPTLPFNGYGELVSGLYAGLGKDDPRCGFGRDM